MIKKRTSLLLFFAFTMLGTSQAQVGIGTTTPNPNTMLDIDSEEKGVLLPRMTTAQRDANLEDDNPLTPPPSDLEEGTIIFNTDENALQFWSAADQRWSTVGNQGSSNEKNEGVVIMDFPNPIDLGLSAGRVQGVIVIGAEVDNSTGVIATNGGISRDTLITRQDFGTPRQLRFNNSEFDLNADGTFWPENSPAQTKANVWNEADNTILENPTEGQVHLFNITFRYQKASKDTTVEVNLTNPNSGFEVNGQHRATEVDLGGSNYYTASVLLLTVADSNSIPGGSGNGYEISFSANGEIDIEVTKIVRVSLYKD